MTTNTTTTMQDDNSTVDQAPSAEQATALRLRVRAAAAAAAASCARRFAVAVPMLQVKRIKMRPLWPNRRRLRRRGAVTMPARPSASG